MVANRFDHQFYTQGQSGGLNYYPFSGVLEGVKLSYVSAATNVVTLASTVGRVRLDSVLVDVPARASIPITVANNVTTPGNDVNFEVYLNPARQIPAVYTLPGSPALNAKVLLVADLGVDQAVTGFKQWNGTAWVDFKPIKEPPNYQQNNMPMHNILNVANVGQFSSVAEKVIYHNTVYPVYVNSPSRAYLRKSGAVKLGDVFVVAGATPTVTVVPYGNDTLASI